MGDQSYSVIDIINEQDKFEIVGFVDKKKSKNMYKYPYLGTDKVLKKLFEKGVNYAFPAIGIGKNVDIYLREKVFNSLKNIGFKIPNLISKNAIINQGVKMNEGNLVMAGSILDNFVKLGSNISIGINCSIGHSSKIFNNATLAGGVVLNGSTKIGKNTFIGMASVIYESVGNYCKIMPNITVMDKIGSKSIVFNDISNKVFKSK